MSDPSKWGKKYTCFGCACKFYDLNKPQAICPKCGADQADKAKPEEEVLEEEVLEETTDKLDAEDGADGAVSTESDDDLPPMEEELGYDETDEEE